MSRDARASRSDIEMEVSGRTRDKEQHIEKLRSVVADKSAVVKTAKRLRLAGTNEGARGINEATDGAVRETRREFARREKDLEAEVLGPAAQMEKDLESSKRAALSDRDTLQNASLHLNERGAHHRVAEASHQASEDAYYLNKSRQRVKETLDSARDQLARLSEELNTGPVRESGTTVSPPSSEISDAAKGAQQTGEGVGLPVANGGDGSDDRNLDELVPEESDHYKAQLDEVRARESREAFLAEKKRQDMLAEMLQQQGHGEEKKGPYVAE